MSKKEQNFRWKGKWVSEKVYNRKMKLIDKFKCSKIVPYLVKDKKTEMDEAALNEEKNIRDATIVLSSQGTKEIIRLPEIETVYYKTSNDDSNKEPEEDSPLANKVVEGRRIVELSELGKRLWCGTCKEALSLSNIERECRRGLGSLLLVRCHKCLIVNEVITSKMHALNTDSRANRFDVNTDLILGVLNSGVSLGMVNKIHNYLKLPLVNHSSFKSYQQEIGDEEVAAIRARRLKVGPSPLLLDDAEDS